MLRKDANVWARQETGQTWLGLIPGLPAAFLWLSQDMALLGRLIARECLLLLAWATFVGLCGQDFYS